MSNYEISLHPTQKMSPFPVAYRPFTDSKKGSRTAAALGPSSIPDLARVMYGVRDIIPYSDLKFGFIKRDLKDTTYTYGTADPFVMKTSKSADLYFQSALELINVISELWKSFDLPLKMDQDRKILVPDTTHDTVKTLMSNPSTPEHVRADVRLMAANADVLKKTAMVRAIPIGWWVAAYDGLDSRNPRYLKVGVDAVVKAMLALRNSTLFKSKLDATLAAQGDPLWTSVGYPLYSAELTKEGKPLSKIKVLQQYSGMLSSFPASAEDVKTRISERGRNAFEKAHPLAIASLRRSQQGYKWAHLFEASSRGLVASKDMRGLPTTRVAFQAAYLHNLIISPIQSEWKTLRKMIPGMTFDGDDRKAILKMLAGSDVSLVESDYSGYDRSIPHDITSAFFKAYCDGLGQNGTFWRSMLETTHSDLDLLWPDYASENEAILWTFRAPKLALLSGLKITSEMGTFMNLIINVAGWINEGLMTRDEVHNYLTISLRDPDWKSRIKPADVKVLIQSDDELMILPNEAEARKYENAFLKSAEAAGVEAKIEIGDKFLSRHMTAGVDTPVIARVFQNTVSNETPTVDPWKFLMGLVARTDGLAGCKTVDPFGTGHRRSISAVERKLTHAVIIRLIKQLSTAAVPIPQGLDFLKLYKEGLELSSASGGRYKVSDDYAQRINKARSDITAKFARLQAEAFADGDKSFQNSMLAELWTKKDSPAAAMALEELLVLRPELRALLDKYAFSENHFYRFAMSELGWSIKV